MSNEVTDYSTVDRMTHAWQARFTAGISPEAVMLAYLDWLVHLANSPNKQLQLLENFYNQSTRFSGYALLAGLDPDYPPVVEPSSQDKRFTGEKWQQWPYNLFYQSFLLS